jgi:HAD superfamily hydrolase (TIGR01509 family)
MGLVGGREGMSPSPGAGTRCVLFDVGGVLIQWDDEVAFARIARRYGLDLGQTSRVLSGLRNSLQTGQLTLHEFWSRFAHRFDLAIPEDWRTLWVSELARRAQPRRGIQILAADLRRQGVRTGVFSNTDASHWSFFRSRGWLAGFSPGIASFQLGAVKPDLAAFQRASRRLPTHSGPPVFIDDRLVNVRAARRSGWDAVLFTTVPGLRREMRARGLLA